MKKCFLRLVSFLCAACLLGSVAVSAVDYDTTAAYIVETVASPKNASIGGEWSVIGIARGEYSGSSKTAFNENYLAAANQAVKEKGGKMSSAKSTEYSRMILALSSLGKNAKNTAGYDLYSGLSDMSFVTKQGLNGSIFALIALDAKNTAPRGNVTRQALIRKIIAAQNSDGGFSLSAAADSDVDVTAMALQALAPYKCIPKVSSSIESALSFLSKKQNSDGSYTSYGNKNCESACQVVIALCTLDISPNTDSRFVKNGKSVYASVLSFGLPDGSFKHVADKGANLMATEQALCAMAAYKRLSENKSALYDMSGYTCPFTDISSSARRDSIKLFAKLGVVNGTTRTTFSPTANVTRAEFCTMLAKMLVLPAAKDAGFSDVKKGDWYYGYVNSAFASGVVNGKGSGKFCPNDKITREEAAVMLERASKKYAAEYRSHGTGVLTAFSDASQISSWAKNSVAYCVSEKMYVSESGCLSPSKALTREELAAMFCGFWLGV